MQEEQIKERQQKRDRAEACKDLVRSGSYSVIFVVVALIAIRPLMVDQILSRAEAYSAFGLYEESKRQCDKALLIDSDNSQAWCSLARVHKAQGDPNLACTAYLKAIETDPANMLAHFELALIYAQQKRYQAAIPHFDGVRKLESDKAGLPLNGRFAYHRAALDMLLICYEKTGDPEKVEFTRKEIGVYYPHSKLPPGAIAGLDKPSDR